MFRLPKIDAQTDSERLKQIEDFLFQFIRELNMKVESIEELIENKKE